MKFFADIKVFGFNVNGTCDVTTAAVAGVIVFLGKCKDRCQKYVCLELLGECFVLNLLTSINTAVRAELCTETWQVLVMSPHSEIRSSIFLIRIRCYRLYTLFQFNCVVMKISVCFFLLI